MTAARIRAAAVAVAVVLAAAGIVLALGMDDGGPTVTGGIVGESPRFEVETLDGTVLSSDGLRGKTVVVNFWNTWCIPCIREAPALAEFHARHADDDDVVMIGIVRDDTERAVRDHVEEEGIAWEVAMDPRSRAALAFGVTGQPETFVIGPDGVVAAERRGEVSVSDLELMLDEARGRA